MATLIPETLSPGSKVPLGEREILQALAEETEVSKDWIVLHSLDIRRHISKLQGEIDFLVLAPGLGILGVEVKGCDVSRRGGTWTYHYSEPKRSSEGPFKQASSAMHSLREWLSSQGVVEAARVLKHSCVVFTEIHFSEQSPEWNPWEVIDRGTLSRNGIVVALKRSMEQEHQSLLEQKRAGKPGAQWYDPQASRPSIPDVQALVRRLRPDFGYEGSTLAHIERLEQAIQQSTDEQVEVALGALGNDRLILKGAAGTGKTHLALRLTRLWSKEGLRVGLLCFNAMLANWLSGECGREVGENGYVGSFHSFLLELACLAKPDAEDRKFWSNLPVMAAERLLESRTPPERFDVLIVDEAQDLLRPEFLDILDLVLVGGLAGGRWVFAGDFSRQAIYTDAVSEQKFLDLLCSRSAGHATFTLATNCRNAARVATNVALLGGLQPRYRKTLHADLPGQVKPYFAENAASRKRKLREVLTELLTRFKPEQIVVLSPIIDSSAAALYREGSAPELAPLSAAMSRERVGFGTVHGFKGMEAAAVVLTDIRGWETPQDEALLYVGISRARIEVHLILAASQQAAYQRRILDSVAIGA